VDLLDVGVPAVGLLGLDQAERAVGEHRVVALGRDQLALLAAVMRGAISACATASGGAGGGVEALDAADQ